MRQLLIFSCLAWSLAVVSARIEATAAAEDEPPNGANGKGVAAKRLSSEELQKRKAWQEAMSQVPLPRKGCFNVHYPSREWREVPCVTPPQVPLAPRQGPRPLTVGSGNDVSAGVPATPGGAISRAIGSFDTVTGVTSVSSPVGGTATANAYGLQLNTNFFTSTACAGSPNPGCQGWEQFAFLNDGSAGVAFIQYWLISYNTTCPTGWSQFSFPSSTDIYCWRNSATGAGVANQAVTNLVQQSVTGTANATSDSVRWARGGTMSATNGGNFVAAAGGWEVAEFNIFGYCCGDEATFNAGSTIVPRTRIFYGGTAAPDCRATGFTGETNNLSFGPNAPPASAPGPAVFFTESSAGGATSSCAAATAVGDTHLDTFHGLFYDFQASGDFVLAEVGSDFVVQVRQVSGAPTWPNASVNNAVATRMGKNGIAICLGEERLNINGQFTDLRDGQTQSLLNGVDITRRGNSYFITDQSGNSLRADVHSKYINATVGLGRWPAEVRGLLANVNENVSQVAARDGTVLTAPFAFEELYGEYGDSWRIPAKDSLLNACGTGEGIERGIPDRSFYAKDLDLELYERTRAVCMAAGVRAGPLLDACTLDVAVIGDDAAADVFVDARLPVVEGIVAARSRGSGSTTWCDLLVVLLLIVSILLAVAAPSTGGPFNLIKWALILVSWVFVLYYVVTRL